MDSFLTTIQNFANSFVNFFFANLFWLRFGSLVFSIAIFLLIIYFNLKLNLTGEKIEHWIDVVGSKDIPRRHSLRAWKKIQKRLKIGGEVQLKLAILEADRILDDMLKLAGAPGGSTDERLDRASSDQLSNIHEVKNAHALRDRIVAEPNLVLTKEEVEVALEIYKGAFVEFGLMDE